MAMQNTEGVWYAFEGTSERRIEQPVLDAMSRKFPGVEFNLRMEQLCWSSLNDCYFFNWAGMLHGVETDGYIHT